MLLGPLAAVETAISVIAPVFGVILAILLP